MRHFTSIPASVRMTSWWPVGFGSSKPEDPKHAQQWNWLNTYVNADIYQSKSPQIAQQSHTLRSRRFRDIAPELLVFGRLQAASSNRKSFNNKARKELPVS